MRSEHQNRDENELEPEFDEPLEDEVELEETEERIQDKLRVLRDKLKAGEAERRDCLEELQRVRADFLNSKRRLDAERVRDSERISEKHLEELLPLADSFEIAMKDPVWKSVDEKWRLGVEGIYSQLMTIFKNNDLTVFNPLGEEFDPREHEALIDTGTDNIIGEVIQSGYKRGEKVVRPAKVAVGTKKK